MGFYYLTLEAHDNIKTQVFVVIDIQILAC